MPTFDFANILKSVVKAALSAVTNPIGLILALSVTVGGVMDSILALGFSQYFPSFDVSPIELSDGSGLLQLALYCMRVDLASMILSRVVGFFIYFLGFVLGFFPTFLTALFIYRSKQAITQTVKDSTT